MPQLNLLKTPGESVLALEVWMPTSPHQRWAISWCALDASRRIDSSGALNIARGCEKADLGFVLKAAYDHWFNADPQGLGSLIERELRSI